jgi:hypothetical protein
MGFANCHVEIQKEKSDTAGAVGDAKALFPIVHPIQTPFIARRGFQNFVSSLYRQIEILLVLRFHKEPQRCHTPAGHAVRQVCRLVAKRTGECNLKNLLRLLLKTNFKKTPCYAR